MKIKTGAFLISLLALSATARGADRSAEARQLFNEANAQFAIGEFKNAGEKYQAAYVIKQDPALLYNAAQAFRLAGDNEKALVLYKNYLQFYPREKNIEEVRGQIAKLKEAIAAQEKARTSPPTTTAEHVIPMGGNRQPIDSGPTTPATTSGALPTSTTTTTASTPVEPPPATTTATAPATEIVVVPETHHKKPVYKKWWFWTIVGVIVVGAVVGGAVAATSSSPWATGGNIGPGAHTQGLSVSW